MAKAAAKDDKITKKSAGDEKEFSASAMTVEGTKDLEDPIAPAPDPPVDEPEAAESAPEPSDKPITIKDILPALRKKGMRI